MAGRRSVVPMLLVFALPLATGCGASMRSSYHHHHHHHDDGAALIAGALFGAVVVAAATQDEPEPEHVVYVHDDRPNVYVVPAPSRRDQPAAPLPTGFDAPAARSALGAVDLAPCKAKGAPRGWGHATVTYTPQGDVAKVVVDEPDGLSAPAVTCIGDRLGTARVAAFSGMDTKVGVTWFVP